MSFKSSICILLLAFAYTHSFSHVQLNTPLSGDYFAPGDNITIKWTETQEHGDSNWDIFYSLDGGESWLGIAIDLEKTLNEYSWEVPFAETNIAKVKIVQDNDEGTDYEGIAENITISVTPPDIEEPEIITALEDINTSAETGLHLSNYPNPFNKQTTIQFSLTERSHVQLNVYNMLGKIVFEGVNEFLDKGTHDFLWENNDFSHGIYLCRLVVDDQKFTRKMVLRP